MGGRRFGPFVLHADRHQLLRHGAEVHLTPKAFDLLALLVEQAPAVVTKAEIHTRLWPGTFVADATLVGVVKEVRRALGEDHGAFIRTVHRVGYAFDDPIEPHPVVRTVPACWVEVGSRRIRLQDGVTVIGRDPEVAVWLDVPGVSRRHARITVDDGAATLEDLDSKKGTLLGDHPVRGPVRLRNADRIQIATEVLIFHESKSGVSTATHPVPNQKLKRSAT